MATPGKPIHSAKNPSTPPKTLATLLGQDSATDRLLSKHPRASAELLEQLSHSSDKATRARVTGNPNTSSETYLRLGAQFPEEFLANPILDLLLIENPTLLHGLPDTMLVQIMRKPVCPPDFLTWAAAHASAKVQLAVAMNAKAPPEALERLHRSVHAVVREALSSQLYLHADASNAEALFTQAMRDWLGALPVHEAYQAWKKGDIDLTQFSALNQEVQLLLADALPILQGESLEQLASICDEPVLRTLLRVTAAQNPATEAATLNGLFHCDWKVKKALAGNLSTPTETLEKLSEESHLSVRYAAAENPNTPTVALEKLAEDKDRLVRIAAAGNPNTPAAALEKLGQTDVGGAVAENPSTPAATLEKLGADVEEYVRRAVAKNRSTPISTLEKLALDEDDRVRSAVARNPDTPAWLLKQMTEYLDIDMVALVAANPNAPLALLEGWATHVWAALRAGVAANPSAPSALLEQLARDRDAAVRKAVAGNPRTTEPVLSKLGGDKNADVRQTLLLSRHTPVDLRRTLYPALAARLKVSQRIALAQDASVPPDLLKTLTQDPERVVYLSVWANPATPADARQALEDRLRSSDPGQNPGCHKLWAKATAELRAAVQTGDILYSMGKKAESNVLNARRSARLMGLCARSVSIPPERLARVSVSTDWLTRAAVARHPGTPPNLRKKLAQDVHPLVAALAKMAGA